MTDQQSVRSETWSCSMGSKGWSSTSSMGNREGPRWCVDDWHHPTDEWRGWYTNNEYGLSEYAWCQARVWYATWDKHVEWLSYKYDDEGHLEGDQDEEQGRGLYPWLRSGEIEENEIIES